jgi:hypothetical protein
MRLDLKKPNLIIAIGNEIANLRQFGKQHANKNYSITTYQYKSMKKMAFDTCYNKRYIIFSVSRSFDR